jgi:hypothetical protein
VPCHLAPQDFPVGGRFRRNAHELIGLCEKFLIILSRNSIQSIWVEDEVEAAFEKESKHEERSVVIPICLDSAFIDAQSGWPATLRRTRHILNFSEWKSGACYKQAFDCLLQALKKNNRNNISVHPSAHL